MGDLTKKVERASTDFKKNNSDLKRKYLIWSIYTFNRIASRVSACKATFRTSYPFYALGENLNGELPIALREIFREKMERWSSINLTPEGNDEPKDEALQAILLYNNNIEKE